MKRGQPLVVRSDEQMPSQQRYYSNVPPQQTGPAQQILAGQPTAPVQQPYNTNVPLMPAQLTAPMQQLYNRNVPFMPAQPTAIAEQYRWPQPNVPIQQMIHPTQQQDQHDVFIFTGQNVSNQVQPGASMQQAGSVQRGVMGPPGLQQLAAHALGRVGHGGRDEGRADHAQNVSQISSGKKGASSVFTLIPPLHPDDQKRLDECSATLKRNENRIFRDPNPPEPHKEDPWKLEDPSILDDPVRFYATMVPPLPPEETKPPEPPQQVGTTPGGRPIMMSHDRTIYLEEAQGQRPLRGWAVFTPWEPKNFFRHLKQPKLIARFKVAIPDGPLALVTMIEDHDRNVNRPDRAEFPSGWWLACNDVVVIFSADEARHAEHRAYMTDWFKLSRLKYSEEIHGVNPAGGTRFAMGAMTVRVRGRPSLLLIDELHRRRKGGYKASTGESAGPSAGPSTGPSTGPSAGPYAGPNAGQWAGPSARPSTESSIGSSIVPRTALSAGTGAASAARLSTTPSSGPSAGPSAQSSAGPSAGPRVGPSAGQSAGPSAEESSATNTGQRAGSSARPGAGPSSTPSAGPGAAPSASTSVGSNAG